MMVGLGFSIDEIAYRIGWTLVHSIWQITLIGVLFWALNQKLSRKSANSRYLVGCAAMALMLIVPVCWMMFTSSAVPVASESLEGQVVSSRPIEINQESLVGRQSPQKNWHEVWPDGRADENATRSISTYVTDDSSRRISDSASTHRLVTTISGIWCIGVVLISFRPVLGFVHANRIYRSGRLDVPESVQSLVDRLSEAMNIRGVIRVTQSTIALTPCVVGWFRPVILLPASAITGLSTQELESILAHELAHIRRHDYLVNIVQMTIETLLFFHPVMWWVSRRVRREREYCCDDLAIRVCGNREDLARALLAIGGIKTRSRLVLASDGTALFERVERILGSETANTKVDALLKHWLRNFFFVIAFVGAIGVATFSQSNKSPLPSESSREEATVSGRNLNQPPSMMTNSYPIYGGETVDGNAAWLLFCAAADGDVSKIESLLKKDSNLVHAQHWYSIPLRFAVLGGHTEAVRMLLDAGSEPGIAEANLYDWETLLEDSKSRGFNTVHQALLAEMKKRYRAEPYNEEFQALRDEIVEGKTDAAIERLKSNPALAKISDVRGNSALHWAVWIGNATLVDICCDLGANLNAKNTSGETPLQVHNVGRNRENYHDSLPAIRRLIERGAEYDFHTACYLGDVDKVRELLANDSSIAKRLNDAKVSPLLRAAAGGNVEVVQMLLNAEANPNLKERKFMSGGALFMASSLGHIDVVHLLLERGANTNGPCESSGTSADHAATDEIYQLLLKYGSVGKWTEDSNEPEALRERIMAADVTQGENGFDPLLARVIWSGDTELLKLYVEKFGADNLKKMFPGSGPGGWFVPKDGVSPEFLDRLTESGFQIDRPSWNGRTNLHFAASRNHVHNAKLFIERGADINHISLETGTTPLGIAARYGHMAMVQLLIEAGADPNLPIDQELIQPLALSQRQGHTKVADLIERLLKDSESNPQIDYGKRSYESRKSGGRIRQVRLRSEMSREDIEFKIRKAIALLGENQRIQLSVLFRGAEIVNTDKGKAVLNQVIDALVPDHGAIASPAEQDGRQLVCVIESNSVTQSPKATVPKSDQFSDKILFLQPDHPFIEAVREVNLPRVKELVTEDESLVNAQVRGDIYLKGKVWKGDEHVDVYEGAPHRAGALHFAAFSSHAKLVQLLIGLGADIRIGANFGEERDSGPVGIAAWNGDAATLKVLLDAAKAAGQMPDLTPGLQSALAHSAWDKADLLLEYGAEHDFYTAAMIGDVETLKELIVSEPDSIDQKHSGFDGTPLEEALKVGRLEIAELLEEYGANVTTKAAAAMGRLDDIQELLDEEPDTITKKFGKYPLLDWAIFGGQAEVVQLLLEHGADPNGFDEWRTTPLGHCALVQGEKGAAIVDILVAVGADVNKKSRGATPLAIAESHHNEHVARRLRYHMENAGEGNELESKSMNEEKKMHEEFWNAVVQNNIDHVKSMLETDRMLAGRNFDPGSLHSHSFPLVQACKNGNLELMKVLIDAGADPNADTHADPNARLKSKERLMFGMPLMHALDAGRLDIINFLLDKGASVDAHPNCDRDFATRVYADATAAGAPPEMIMQGLDFLNDEQKSASKVEVDSSTPEMVKLFQKILTLGAKPRVMEMIRNQHYDAIEAVLRNDPGSEPSPGDWIGATNHEVLLYGAAWYGDPKTMKMCLDVCGDRHTTYAAAYCIVKAIKSHNRDGNFAEYRQIIKVNLEFLQKNDATQEAMNEYDWFNPLFSLSTSFIKNNNYGHRCTVPNTMDDLLVLAELLIEHGCDVNKKQPESGTTPLSSAIEEGQDRYVELLRKHGAK